MTTQSIWFERVDGTRQSLSQFTEELTQEHLAAFTARLHSLQEIFALFEEREIRPVHCKEAIKTLQGVNECVEKFYGLLKKTTDLPLVIVALRYELLVPLYRIEELIY